MFEKFTQQLVSALAAKNSNELTFSNNGNSSFKRNCHFCSSVSHLLLACDIVEQTIKVLGIMKEDCSFKGEEICQGL